MVYRFVIVSDEIADFRRDIKIDSSANFMDFNDAILDSVAYAHNELTCFYLCNDSWKKQTEVHIMDMRMNPEEDVYIMEDTYLDELIYDQGQKLMFVFDMLMERAFYIELREIIISENIEKAEVCRKEGDAPQQITDPVDMINDKLPKRTNKSKAALPVEDDDPYRDDELFSDDDYTSLDEIDDEGFSINDY